MEAHDPFQHSFLRGVLVEGLAEHDVPSLVLRMKGPDETVRSIRHWHRCCVVALSRWSLCWLPAFIREEVFHLLRLCVVAVRLLRRSRSTHVVVRNVWQVAAVMIILRPLLKKPVCYQDAFFNEEHIVFSIGSKRRYSWKERVKIAYHRTRIIAKHWCLRHCDHVFVMSKEMQRYYLDHRVEKSRLTVMPMGVLPSMLKADSPVPPAAQNLPPGRFVLVYLGSLAPVRSPEVMIDAFERAWALDKRLFLVMVGGTKNELGRLTDLCPTVCEQGRYRLTGQLPFDMVFPMLRCAHVGLSVVPPCDAYRVASVTKLVEMLACGLPVIANHEIPEQAELIRATGALLPCDFTVESISEAMLRAASLGPELSRMGCAGREYALRERGYDKLAEIFVHAILNKNS